MSGFSSEPYHYNNVARHVGGDPYVNLNRALLKSRLVGQPNISWLNQTHSTVVVSTSDVNTQTGQDAVYSQSTLDACCVMTADCLPVFFWSQSGDQIAVAHAGWRGLANGILVKTLAKFDQPKRVFCGIGPAISQKQFEVGQDVFDAFSGWLIGDSTFSPGRQPGKYWCNLPKLAQWQLLSAGVSKVYLSNRCSYSEKEHFYSYRRDGLTGRMANLIWKVD